MQKALGHLATMPVRCKVCTKLRGSVCPDLSRRVWRLQRFCKPSVGGSVRHHFPFQKRPKTSEVLGKTMAFLHFGIRSRPAACVGILERLLVCSLVPDPYQQGRYQHAAYGSRRPQRQARRPTRQILRWWRSSSSGSSRTAPSAGASPIARAGCKSCLRSASIRKWA